MQDQIKIIRYFLIRQFQVKCFAVTRFEAKESYYNWKQCYSRCTPVQKSAVSLLCASNCHYCSVYQEVPRQQKKKCVSSCCLFQIETVIFEITVIRFGNSYAC